MCADGRTRFVAEFPTADTVVISRDGVTVRELPRTGDAPQRFEDAEYAYVFAGEGVTVTTKKSGATLVCSQPTDPNLAPVNFGDAGEGGSVQQDVALIVSESIVGVWRDATDTKFVRSFRDGGGVEDTYDGRVVSTGSFVIFTADQPLTVPYPLETGVVYLRVTLSGSQADTLYFKVARLTPESLELVYLNRGGTLVFTRVP